SEGSGVCVNSFAASVAAAVTTVVVYSPSSTWTASSRSNRKAVTPNNVPTIAVPRCSAARAGRRLANAAVHLTIDVLLGARKGRVEGDPHAHAEKRHDEHSDGRADHTLAPLVSVNMVANPCPGRIDDVSHVDAPLRSGELPERLDEWNG